MTEAKDKVTQVIDGAVTRTPLPLVIGKGQAHAILGPETGARYRTFNILRLEDCDRTRALSHAGECVYYVMAGVGEIEDLADTGRQALTEGTMLHIGPGDRYRLHGGAGGMTLLGGTVPLDPALYQLGALEDAQ